MKIKMYRSVFSGLFLAVVLVAISCSDDDDEKKMEATLYTRLGGIDAIAAVTDQFLANVAADEMINERFAPAVDNPSRLQLLRNNLVDQICQGAGGPCIYKGKTMLAAHQGMNITEEEFNALVGDLVEALDQFNVPEKEKNELLGVLGPMKSDIVGK